MRQMKKKMTCYKKKMANTNIVANLMSKANKSLSKMTGLKLRNDLINN